MPNLPLDDARPPRHDIPLGGRSGFVEIDGRQLHYRDDPESFVGLVKGFLREIGA